jgi:hypothetical protein
MVRLMEIEKKWWSYLLFEGWQKSRAGTGRRSCLLSTPCCPCAGAPNAQQQQRRPPRPSVSRPGGHPATADQSLEPLPDRLCLCVEPASWGLEETNRRTERGREMVASEACSRGVGRPNRETLREFVGCCGCTCLGWVGANRVKIYIL